MKNLFTQITAIIVVAITMASCKNDGELGRFAAPSVSAFNGLRAEALASLVQTKTFDVEEELIFDSNKGARLYIAPGCLVKQDGTPATGDASLTFVEIYDIGNMVATNKPLMGKNQDDDLEPLVTGGQFFIEIKQGNEILKPNCHYQLIVDPTHTGGVDPAMSLWEGAIDENGDLTWEEVKRDAQGNEGGLAIGDGAAGVSYNVHFNAFGWTNVDRFWSYTGPKTQIKVATPSIYNYSNAALYLAYEDQPGALAQLDTYDTTGKFFTEHYGLVPVGMDVHIIFTSESNGSIVYAIKRVTVADGQTITISENELNTTTHANLVSMINALH